jgi:hypothetical protein
MRSNSAWDSKTKKNFELGIPPLLEFLAALQE